MLFSKNSFSAGPVEWILAGLGNPGSQYEGTRHNTGFMALDTIAKKAGVSIDKLQFQGQCAQAVVGGKKVLLLKPSTYMNLSGQSVTAAMRFYKLPPERTIIFFDDISLPCGRLRLRRKGSDGGHNGMKNIIYLAGSDQFPRVKIGIGAKPTPQWDLADWVLSRFSNEDSQQMQQSFQHAAEAAELLVNGKMVEAMNLYNGKG
ncbi:aminoacyl-tRNA hydrolase [Caproicibacterium lactatifermentans]|jgi:PTH1 family peptidyl-tRNA hydrolase|uniref:Peptidyl-tRNA hydrolase n=1 Tax=Caproicibacterium lactatifermentans TaxID=2666138 RepID=A0A859DMR6_9FIRM|nr:aminoacyl-tRNA hydrolase [Caproicibacterium lactatifermentans]ARP49434.1 aminoacyl-tRNA hydrolase [Ruminococcaceae bacterium CPB6]MDD4806927.1 aminoacyl-tRNA hydrolase [Oscillospiraceae bacterium]QKN23026.1 aminoacyl-tRNA hydrolase [Caproicibacterium lactatifermentans]QKO30368.1 aminoacyl-tRNA hydrolase [Caproicibacterium lactatifermentans]